jgi:uncharacterized membrane protein YebE (DUF533 family)
MLDPERILGALIRQGIGSTRRSRRSRRRSSGLSRLLTPGIKGAAGLGLIGVAIAAFDHFKEKNARPAQGMPPPSAPPAHPPVSPPSAETQRSTPPPPPPGPAAPASASANPEETRQHAVLLIRAMIAAANADGLIDKAERKAIMGRLLEAGLGEDDRSFLERELAEPPDVESLIPAIRTANLNEQAYAASLLAIEVDTPSERDYINYLRLQLGIDERTAEQVHRQLVIDAV